MSHIIRQWNGRTIRQREDGYLSATDMCQACSKLFGHWNALDSTAEYLQALSADIHIPISDLVQIQKGGIHENQGTWVHPEVGVDLAQWLNVHLRIQVNRWTVELMTTGKVEIQPQVPTIAPEVEVAREVDEIYTRLSEKNPRIAQLLVDSRVNRFMGQAALSGTAEVWKGAVEFAEDLGYKTNHKNRGRLGKHVKAIVGHLGKEEERLCNGTNRPIMLYPDTQEVKDAVISFFEEEQQAS